MNRKHEIIALKRRGLKIDEIASILDMPVGEVQLVVNLDGHKA
jgi:DNA-directed RNA polymerase specialized sigma24 family protein